MIKPEVIGFLKEKAFYKPIVSTYNVPTLRQSIQELLYNALRGIGASSYLLENFLQSITKSGISLLMQQLIVMQKI